MAITINEKYGATLERIENKEKARQAKQKEAKNDFAKYINKLLSVDYYKKQISDYLTEKGFLVLFFQEDLNQDKVLNSDIQELVNYYMSEGVFLDTKSIFFENVYDNRRNFCFLFFCTERYLSLHFNNNLNDFIYHMTYIVRSENEGECLDLPQALSSKNYFNVKLFPLLDLDVFLNKSSYEIETGECKTIKYIIYSSEKEKEKILQKLNVDYNPYDVSYENIYLYFMKQIICCFANFSDEMFFNPNYIQQKLIKAKFLDNYIQLMVNYKPIPEVILSKFKKRLIKTEDIKHPRSIQDI